MSGRRERIAAIDMAKGLAITWVMLIHARVLGGSPWMEHLVGDAVAVFVVLFGLNAEQWWRGHAGASAADWYRRYLRRLLVPVWAILPFWWAGDLLVRRVVAFSPGLLLGNLAGWLPNIGTGWFVTMILQLVLVFPLLHAAVRRLDDGALLALALGWTAASATLLPALLERMGATGYVLSAPARFAGHVLFGAFLARRLPVVLEARTGALAFASWVATVLLQEWPAAAAFAPFAERASDLLLATWLLAAMRAGEGVGPVARPLAWLGIHSWGLYVGQMLVHNLVLFALGSWNAFRGGAAAWIYAGLLLGGAIALVVAGERLRIASLRLVAPAR